MEFSRTTQSTQTVFMREKHIHANVYAFIHTYVSTYVFTCVPTYVPTYVCAYLNTLEVEGLWTQRVCGGRGFVNAAADDANNMLNERAM